MTAPSPVVAGTRLGPYEIVSRIGAGGMGEVFRARDMRLERAVAVKVLPPEFGENAQLRLRFEREARTISQLSHPNICTLHDVGTDNGVSYLVMELIEGETLAERLARGPLPVHEVLRFGAQIADALANAHRHGVIHRDLKPGNIMLTKSGAKLLDFGLAKSGVIVSTNSGTSIHHDATQRQPLTAEGTILGTFQYMAPEQLEGTEADTRTDIFALGAVLYEMATGRRAFEGKNKTSLIAAIVSTQPQPIRDLQPVTPPAFEHVVQRCLQKDPEDRWQSAHDIANELRWISEAGSAAGVAVPLVAQRKNRERLAWLAAIVAALAVGALAARSFSRPSPAAPIRFSINRVGDGRSVSQDFVISPDGKSVVFSASGDSGKTWLWLRRFDELHPRRIEGSEGLILGRFAAAGDSLVVYDTAGKVVRLPAGGGVAQVVAELGRGWNTTRMTKKGILLCRGPDRRLYRLAPGDAKPQAITTLDKTRFEIAHNAPVILPDDEHFLFTSYRRDPNATRFASDLYVGNVDGRPARRIGELSSQPDYALGHLYYVTDGALVAAPFDLKALRVTGEPEVVAEGVSYNKAVAQAEFDIADDGTVVYSSAGFAAQLTWFDLDGKQLAQIGAKGPIANASLAPDASAVYVAKIEPRDGVGSLWKVGLTRNITAPLTSDWAYEFSPVVSPDGKQLYYASDRGDFPDIYVKPSDGSRPGRLLLREPGQQTPNSVSPDGRYLLYQTRKDETVPRNELWVLPLDGSSKPFPFTQSPAGEGVGRFSPSGREVAYVSSSGGRNQVYVKTFPPSEETPRQISTDGGTRPRWSVDGKTVFFVSGHKIMAGDPTGNNEPRELFSVRELIRTYEVAPDGKRLLLVLVSEEDQSPPLNVIVGWRPPKK